MPSLSASWRARSASISVRSGSGPGTSVGGGVHELLEAHGRRVAVGQPLVEGDHVLRRGNASRTLRSSALLDRGRGSRAQRSEFARAAPGSRPSSSIAARQELGHRLPSRRLNEPCRGGAACDHADVGRSTGRPTRSHRCERKSSFMLRRYQSNAPPINVRLRARIARRGALAVAEQTASGGAQSNGIREPERWRVTGASTVATAGVLVGDPGSTRISRSRSTRRRARRAVRRAR